MSYEHPLKFWWRSDKVRLHRCSIAMEFCSPGWIDNWIDDWLTKSNRIWSNEFDRFWSTADCVDGAPRWRIGSTNQDPDTQYQWYTLAHHITPSTNLSPISIIHVCWYTLHDLKFHHKLGENHDFNGHDCHNHMRPSNRIDGMVNTDDSVDVSRLNSHLHW